MKHQRQGGFLIGRIHQEAGRLFDRILRAHRIGLSGAQGRVLFLLWREGALPIGELARRTSLGKPALTGMIDRLERDGHVRRVRSEEDRRVILIEPAATGCRAQAAFVAASEEMTAAFYRGFDEAQIDRFEHDLTRILANLEAGPKPRVRGRPPAVRDRQPGARESRPRPR